MCDGYDMSPASLCGDCGRGLFGRERTAPPEGFELRDLSTAKEMVCTEGRSFFFFFFFGVCTSSHVTMGQGCAANALDMAKMQDATAVIP